MSVLIENVDNSAIFDTIDWNIINKIKVETSTAREKWSSVEFKPVYSRIKDTFLIRQGKICFYCQKKLVDITLEDWHIDHIVPIDEDPRHVFTEQNLVLTCKWCNRIKNAKPILKKSLTTNKYSASSNNYLIVHANIDTYSQHLDIISGTLYLGKSPKGKRTISDCNLDRFKVNYFTNISTTDKGFVNAALTLIFSNDPKQLISFIKALPN